MHNFTANYSCRFVLFCTLFFVPLISVAQVDQAVEVEAAEIFSSTMSPFCPGRLLNDCPSSAAHDLKVKVKEKLAAGESKEAVFNYLLTLYGDEVRAAPKNEGFGRAAWLATPVFLFVGLYLIGIFVRRQKKVENIDTKSTKLDEKMERRISEELERI